MRVEKQTRIPLRRRCPSLGQVLLTRSGACLWDTSPWMPDPVERRDLYSHAQTGMLRRGAHRRPRRAATDFSECFHCAFDKKRVLLYFHNLG